MSTYHNIGCVSREQTMRVRYTDAPIAVTLLPNTVYRLVSDTACFFDLSASGALLDPVSSTSGVYLPANTPEYFASTEDKKRLFVASGASGTLWASRVLGARI
jgi:hypothetical protein